MPSRSELSGRASTVIVFSGEISLLLVVHRGALHLCALRIGSTRGNRAALAVGRHDNATTNGDLTVFLDLERQRMVVDLRERPRV
jgi:hypothetical protein